MRLSMRCGLAPTPFSKIDQHCHHDCKHDTQHNKIAELEYLKNLILWIKVL